MSLFNRILILVLATELLLVSIQRSYALYSDSASSTGNIFTAALEFSGGSGATGPSGPVGIATYPVIGEVQIDGGEGNDNDNDFIELYNPTSTEFPLNGYRLIMRTSSSVNDTNIYTFGISDTIPANGFYLWAHDSLNNHYASSINADVSSADTLGANNSVALRYGDLDTGTLVDALSWNSGASSLKENTEFSPNPGIYESMERKANPTSTVLSMMTGSDFDRGNGLDTDNNSTDFILRTTSNPQNSISGTEIP